MKRLILLVLVACFFAGVDAQAKRPDSNGYNIIYIGNSITYGALHADRSKTAPPVVATEFVNKKLGCVKEFANSGRSGATTVDYLPALNRDFRRVENTIAALKEKNDAKFVFSFMLGTNDSASTGPTGAPVSNEDYKKNLLIIIARLRELCPDAIFVLQRPVWYSPNTYNGARYLVAGLNRMTDAVNVLVELANENNDIYLGDCDSYDLIKLDYQKYMFAEEGRAGTFYLHPNEEGAAKMAKNWGKAIVAAIKSAAR